MCPRSHSRDLGEHAAHSCPLTPRVKIDYFFAELRFATAFLTVAFLTGTFLAGTFFAAFFGLTTTAAFTSAAFGLLGTFLRTGESSPRAPLSVQRRTQPGVTGRADLRSLSIS